MGNLALSTERSTNSRRRHDAPARAGRNRGEAMEKPWRSHGEIMVKSDVLKTQNRVRDWL